MTAAPATPSRGRPGTSWGGVLTWGPRVRFERRRRGWSQTQLASLAGCSATAVSRLENGARRTPDSVRVTIARALEIDPAELFPYEDVPAARRRRRAAA